MPNFDWKNSPEVCQYLERLVDNYKAGLEQGQRTEWARDLAPPFMVEYPDFCVGETAQTVTKRIRSKYRTIVDKRTIVVVPQPQNDDDDDDDDQPTRQELLNTIKDLHKRLKKKENSEALLKRKLQDCKDKLLKRSDELLDALGKIQEKDAEIRRLKEPTVDLLSMETSDEEFN